MHNEAFVKLGLDYAYIAFEVGNEELEDTIKGFRAMKVRGSNVSMPNKTVVHKYLDHLSEAAAFKLFAGKDMPIEYMKEVLDIKY